MRIARPTPIRTVRETVTAFGGYDHRPVIPAGSWYDEQNITADNYPTATVRGAHGALTLSGGSGPVTGIFEANGKEGYTRFVSSGRPAANHGTVSFYDPSGSLRTVDLGLSSALKRFVRMGAYLLIFPDGAYVNTADTETGEGHPESGSFARRSYPMYNDTDEGYGVLTVSPVDENGGTLTYTASSTEPRDPEDGDLWYSTVGKALYKYYAGYGWRDYGQTYMKLSWNAHTFAAAFDFEEGLFIRLVVEQANGDYGYVGAQPDSGYYKCVKTGLDDGHRYIVIPYKFGAGTITAYDMNLSWGIPDLDFVVESNNRLWGCKYGRAQVINEDGDLDWASVNEIYASALGSFKEWYSFEGTESDSYVASVGSDGAFTGAVSYQGRPIFYKERVMHQVYGSYPSAYQIVATECRGIEAGSDRSAAIVDNVLYYHSPEGFAAFDGSLPVMIDAPLGGVRYVDVSAGGHNRKYFATATDQGGTAHVLIYNARLALWEHAEARSYDATGLAACTLWASIGDDMCYIDAVDSFESVRTWYGTGTKETAPVKWYAETGDLGLGDLFGKYVILLAVRIRLAVGSTVTVRIRYDDGPWEHATRKAGTSLVKFALPVRVKRCDHFRIRLEGEGDAQIYAIERTIQGGSRK